MQPGDLIVAVNGIRTLNVYDYVCARHRRKSAMEVVFVRGHIYYEATVHWPEDAHLATPTEVAKGRATTLADGGFELFAPNSPGIRTQS